MTSSSSTTQGPDIDMRDLKDVTTISHLLKEIDNFDCSGAAVGKGSRVVIKFRGGYDDPNSPLDNNLPPDTRLPGENCIEINYEEWTDMDTLEAASKKYVAISYKHDLRYPDRKTIGSDKKETYRAMRAPKIVVDEAVKGMKLADVKKYWHDGGKPLWHDNLPTCRGSYPYLLDGGRVLIIPPFCNRNMIDVRSWCPSNYPEAAKGMLAMSRYKLVINEKSKPVLLRRRKAGVPSVAWGDANRVWLLSEAFCGALRGAIIMSQSSLNRYKSFLAEIEFCIIGLMCLKGRHSRKSPGFKILDAVRELLSMRSDVKEYLAIVTDPSVRKDGMKLSSFFVERMAIAGSSYEADRTLLGAVTTFLLEQKFGLGVDPQDALAELEYSEDPFVTALTVSSIGNHSFPLGMTNKQVRDSIILAGIREDISQHVDVSLERPGNIMNQWPQPQSGRCYAGTLTNSAWKNIFLKALYEGRCMGIERKKEKTMLKKKGKKQRSYLHSHEFDEAHKKHLRYRFWPISLSRGGSFSEPSSRHPLFVLFEEYDFANMPEVSHKDLQQEESFAAQYEERKLSIDELDAVWTERQNRYKLVVSGDTPVAISPNGKYHIVYLLDTYGLEGIHLECIEALSANGEAVLIMPKSDNVIELVKNYHGRICQYDIHQTPLLQVVLSSNTSADGIGHLVAMRRVWSLSQNSKVSIAPSKLDKIDENKYTTDAMKLLKDEVFQDDRVIPVSLSEEKMKEYGPKYSIISTTHGKPVEPRSIRASSTRGKPVSPRSVTSVPGEDVDIKVNAIAVDAVEAVEGGAVWAQISESVYSQWLGRVSQDADAHKEE